MGMSESVEFQLCADSCKKVAFEGVKYEFITNIEHLAILIYLHPTDKLSKVAE